ncbi:MAG: M48 family metalloprotease [Alphaproteobacteria bacterium]
MAHEIGHIDKFHVTKRKQSIEDLSILNNLTNISILAGSLISNNNEYMFQSLIGNKLSIQNYFQSFSREQEREADFYAIKTLTKLNLSSTPLKNLLNKLEKNAITQGMKDEFYKFSSHPIYKERYEIINNADNYKIIFDENTNSRFNFIRAKFFGYTEENPNDIKEFLNDEYYDYANSIILSKKGKLKKALFNLNKLIKNNKNNIHLIETKADILYSHGFFSEALLFYDISIKKNPKNYYVKKRIFDIKFSILDIYDNSESKALFHEYKFLLRIFNNNKDLKKKLEFIALKNNFKNWIDYFYIHNNLNNNDYNKENLLNELKRIKKITSDYELIRLIDKVIL